MDIVLSLPVNGGAVSAVGGTAICPPPDSNRRVTSLKIDTYQGMKSGQGMKRA